MVKRGVFLKIVTPQEMYAIEQSSIHKIGIPGMILMENAAIAAAKHIIDYVTKNTVEHAVTVAAGTGNNGGDALALARHLYNKGFSCNIFLTGLSSNLKGDALLNFNILSSMGLKVKEINSKDSIKKLEKSIMDSAIIVDGIFGTGLNRNIEEGIFPEIIDLINQNRKGKFVISLDIPSGINGETGKVMGRAISADMTVTFGLLKQGLILYPGCAFAGKVLVEDISIPPKIIENMDIKTNAITPASFKELLVPRRLDMHKGDCGKALIITGSEGMTGAGILSAMTAMRSGLGLCYVAAPRSLIHIYGAAATECVFIPLDEKDGHVGEHSFQELEHLLTKVDAVLIGPGLSQSDSVQNLVKNVLLRATVPVVVDADAINVLSKDVNVLKEVKTNIILTPHEQEMARLLGESVLDVKEDRMKKAKYFSKKYNSTLVLKGYRSIIAHSDEYVDINVTGTPAMATAGAGDVLSGLTVSLAAQAMRDIDLPAKEIIRKAVSASVYIHGLAGELAEKEKGEAGVIARDIMEFIPRAIKSLKDKYEIL